MCARRILASTGSSFTFETVGYVGHVLRSFLSERPNRASAAFLIATFFIFYELPSSPVLTGVHPAVHRDGLGRDVRVLGDRTDDTRNLLGLPEPPHGDKLCKLPSRILVPR